MHFSRVSLASVVFAFVEASYLNNDLSFGHNERISPNMREVPNFRIIGKPHAPEILSNKLVLTPPAPGNERGAIWSEKVLQHKHWTVDIDFRATGPERGGGNLQIWYAQDGQNKVGTSSIYTVGKFDGLALSVDQYAGSGGYIRGFLNDGSHDYQNHHSVDSLAFGHCEYSYRNLGRPSRISIQQTSDNFRVTVDSNLCFESKKVKLPLGSSWGITAASAENPDSFEVFKLVTTTESHTPDSASADHEPQQSHLGEIPHPGEQAGNVAAENRDIPAYSGINDNMVPASKFRTSEEQFADLHDRMQAMMKYISALNRDLVGYQEIQHKWHDDLVTRISKTEADVNSLRILNDRMDGEHKEKLDTIHKEMQSQRADIHQALEQHVAVLRGAVLNTHHSLSGALDRVGGFHWGKWIGIVVGSQVVTALLYMVYKKRKHGSPKKYL